MTMLTIAVASLRRRLLRTLVGVLSIALASAMLCLSLSATERIRSALDGFDTSSIMIVNMRGPLPISMAQRVRAHLAGNGDVQWNRSTRGAIANKELHFRVNAISDGYLDSFAPAEIEVAPDVKARWLADRQGVLVTADLMARTGWQVGQLISWQAPWGPVENRVAGVSHGAVSMEIFPHYEFFDSLTPQKARIGTLTIHKVTDTDRSIADLNEYLGKDLPILVMRERAMHRRVLAVSGALPNVLEKIALVFAVSTLLVILSNAFVSVRERRMELGALRALGFRRAKVLAMLVVEFLGMGLLAGAVGCLVPLILFHEHGVHLGELALSNVTLPAPICLGVLLMTVTVGSLATLVPALLMLRHDVPSLLEAN